MTTASIDGKGLRSSYIVALVVAVNNVISSSEASYGSLPATTNSDDYMSNRQSRMTSSPLWPSSEVHWAGIPSGLGNSGGWSSWGAKKHMKESNVRGRHGVVLEARQTTAISDDKSSYSDYVPAAVEAVEREHSEHISSSFPLHDPFQNSDSSTSNSFVGGRFESFQQSLRRGEGQGLFGFSDDG